MSPTGIPENDDSAIIFATIPEAIMAIANGEIVVVMDDEDRENEGDLVMAAEMATEEKLAMFVNYTTGILCAPMTADRALELELPPMCFINQDHKGTAFTVTADAIGTGTGVSANDRATTFRSLAGASFKASNFVRPGHVFPLVARPGGVLERRGHTEASVDLCRLAKLTPVAVIAEMVTSEGPMMRLPQAAAFAKEHGLKLCTVEQLVKYRESAEGALSSTSVVEEDVEVDLPIDPAGKDLGIFKCKSFYSRLDGRHHIVMIRGDISHKPFDPVLVRVHSECFTGDVLSSQRCDCGEQKDRSLQMIAARDRGVFIYCVGHEGRGIGLVEKLKAYRIMQDDPKVDTYAANRALNHPEDTRDYHTAIAILRTLGVQRINLLTNNRDKASAFGEDMVVITTPLEGTLKPHNKSYLEAKRKRHGTLTVIVERNDDTPIVVAAAAAPTANFWLRRHPWICSRPSKLERCALDWCMHRGMARP